MRSRDSREPYRSLGTYLVCAALGFFAWIVIGWVAVPGGEAGLDLGRDALGALAEPAVRAGSGRALLGSTAVWFYILISLLVLFGWAFVFRTLARGTSPTAIALGLTTVPALLPLLVLLLSSGGSGDPRGGGSRSVYYGTILAVMLCGALLVCAWAGARAAEIRKEMVG